MKEIPDEYRPEEGVRIVHGREITLDGSYRLIPTEDEIEIARIAPQQCTATTTKGRRCRNCSIADQLIWSAAMGLAGEYIPAVDNLCGYHAGISDWNRHLEATKAAAQKLRDIEAGPPPGAVEMRLMMDDLSPPFERQFFTGQCVRRRFARWWEVAVIFDCAGEVTSEAMLAAGAKWRKSVNRVRYMNGLDLLRLYKLAIAFSD